MSAAGTKPTSMLLDLIALNSAASEVNGTPWKLDIGVTCGPPYALFGTMVKAPVVVLYCESLYGPFTICHSGLIAYVLTDFDCETRYLKMLAMVAAFQP